MTKTTVFFAVSAGIALAIGCSSSSSSPSIDAGIDSGNPDVAAAQPDGPNPLAPPAAGKCPGVPCATGQRCCYNPLAQTGLCDDPSVMCGGVMLGCSAPSDCKGGQVCCGRMGGANGFSLSCTGSDQCTGGAFQLCDSMNPCPAPETCRTFMQGGFCVTPDAGAGGDAAASEAGEAGASNDGGASE
jgi:hypothetical protein